MSSYEHLDTNTQALIDLSATQRANHMLVERFFTHDRLTPIFNKIEFLRYMPPQTRAAGLVVSGPPGSGKSMLASAVERRYGPTRSDGVKAATKPVLNISMTGAREARTLYNRMLGELGVPDPGRYGGSDRERRVLELCASDLLDDRTQLSDTQSEVVALIDHSGQTLERALFFGCPWPADWNASAVTARAWLLRVSLPHEAESDTVMTRGVASIGPMQAYVRGPWHPLAPVRRGGGWDAFRRLADPAHRRAALWVVAWLVVPGLPEALSPGWDDWAGAVASPAHWERQRRPRQAHRRAH